MASAQDLQSLLRFLSQDAKVPLAQALGKVKDLQAAKLNTASDLAGADIDSLKTVFGDEKIARQVLNAAKRVSKKRKASESSGPVPPSPKKAKPLYGQPLNPAEFETSLALPEAQRDEEVLRSAVVFTNRAPLVLAFAVTLLKYTMPDQPISSRLSLAQAVTSMNSKNKAIHIGIDQGHAAEDEGWGEGQPILRIMTRDVRVMKRWGYDWEEPSTQDTLKASTQETLASSEATLVEEPISKEPALWGVDLEALKKAAAPNNATGHKASSSQLPIFTAQSARAYLMKAFETPKDPSKAAPAKKQSGSVMAAEKERNLGMVLGALELLYESWVHVLGKEDLDKRAWGWYVRVRPEVATGAAGWGGKGNVKLSDILDLRRPIQDPKREPE
ncbi:hypothetical protein CC86DRAFT_363331 [Ophiobolus disseminans]|uniref:Impact N-terminal domain-containing protein n=1 Tax=Ophiobolus disseminans TaxID=1469910 RepID=A0A6A6ZE05_9PLEO|nr:hypothetical protein CC86DRAFT_363331 [Ophiobolus disseminans]